MSNAEQNAARERLLSMLHYLTSQGSREGVPIDRSPDALDHAQQASDREVELAGLEREVALLNQVRLALQRLERGEYGRCVRCDGRIGAKRLKALPWAGMCLNCQEHAEAEQETLSRANGVTPSLTGWE